MNTDPDPKGLLNYDRVYLCRRQIVGPDRNDLIPVGTTDKNARRMLLQNQMTNDMEVEDLYSDQSSDSASMEYSEYICPGYESPHVSVSVSPSILDDNYLENEREKSYKNCQSYAFVVVSKHRYGCQYCQKI